MDVSLNEMSRAELRAYLIAHPNDPRAFTTFVDRFASDASSETFSADITPSEFEQLLQQHNQRRQSNT